MTQLSHVNSLPRTNLRESIAKFPLFHTMAILIISFYLSFAVSLVIIICMVKYIRNKSTIGNKIQKVKVFSMRARAYLYNKFNISFFFFFLIHPLKLWTWYTFVSWKDRDKKALNIIWYIFLVFNFSVKSY